MKPQWTVIYDSKVRAQLVKLKSEKLIDVDDFDLLKRWLTQVENFGPSSLRKTKRIDDFNPLYVTDDILNREESLSNFWHDHDLNREWFGYRSSSFGQLGRVIYKIENNELKIVKVEKVTATHNYKKE